MVYLQGITGEQAGGDIAEWIEDSNTRKMYLNIASKLYMFMKLCFVIINVTTAAITTASGASLTYGVKLFSEEQVGTLLLVVGVVDSILLAIDKNIDPGSKSESCASSIKHLNQLNRELLIGSNEAFNNTLVDVPSQVIKSQMATYSGRLQLIHEQEPPMFFIDTFTKFWRKGKKEGARNRLQDLIREYKKNYEESVPEIERLNLIDQISRNKLTKYQVHKMHKVLNKVVFSDSYDDFIVQHGPGDESGAEIELGPSNV